MVIRKNKVEILKDATGRQKDIPSGRIFSAIENIRCNRRCGTILQSMAYSNDISSETEVVTMNPKLPYYMTYPMPLAYDDERMERRDYEYMKSLYPDTAKKVLPYVEEECDRNEYPCSMIYDEYPDRLSLRLMRNRIFDKVVSQEKMDPQDWLRNLIEVMLYQELFKRRSDDRRNRRKFY